MAKRMCYGNHASTKARTSDAKSVSAKPAKEKVVPGTSQKMFEQEVSKESSRAKRTERTGKMKKADKPVITRRLVRYQEGADYYSIGINLFRKLVESAGASYRLEGIVLVDCDIFEDYLEQFHVPAKENY